MTVGTDRTPGLRRPGGSRVFMRTGGPVLALVALLTPLLGASPSGAATTSITTSLNSSSSGSSSPRATFSFRPWISGDGRFVAFDSDSSTLVPGDTNKVRDIFVYDRENGTVERVSLGPGGRQANGDSQRPTLSGDGRLVAFWSAADNLVDTDTNNVTDCFVHDRQTHETFRVNLGPENVEANGECARPVITADGRLVAFESAATNLEPRSVLNKSTDTNKARDVFVRDLEAGKTWRVSVTSDGKQGSGESVRPAFSADGRYVAFQSDAPLQADDTNKKTDVYLHDLDTKETTRISIGPGGVEGNGGSFSPSLSADGRYIAYWSNASNLVANDTNRVADVFVFDRTDGSTTRVSIGADDVQGDGMSADPSISPDGRHVAFWSAATNLVPDDTNGKRDIFLFDREAGSLTRVSVADDGTESDGDSFSPNISAGGALVAFDSAGRTLVPDDRKTKGSDIYLHWEDTPPDAGPPAQQPSADQPSADQPSAGQPSSDQPSSDQPSNGQPSGDQPSGEPQPAGGGQADPPAEESPGEGQPPPDDSSP